MQVEQLLPAATVILVRGVLGCPYRHGTVRGHGRGRLSGHAREETPGLMGLEPLERQLGAGLEKNAHTLCMAPTRVRSGPAEPGASLSQNGYG